MVGDRKINKIYQRKLKSGDRLWALDITNWKLRLYGKLFYIRQTLQLSQFFRVSLAADLCALLINALEKLNNFNKLIGKSKIPKTSKMEFFVTSVNAVN